MDDCPRQDPAYRPAKGKPRFGGAFLHRRELRAGSRVYSEGKDCRTGGRFWPIQVPGRRERGFMSTTPRLVALVVGLAPLGLAGPASAAVYGGDTEQSDPIAITLAKRGQVKSIGVMWTAPCQSGMRVDYGRILTASKKPPSVIGPGDNPVFAKVKKGRLSGTSLSTTDF